MVNWVFVLETPNFGQQLLKKKLLIFGPKFWTLYKKTQQKKTSAF